MHYIIQENFKKMIKEFKETKTTTVTVKKRLCDDCGKEIHISLACSVSKCEICRKDLCDKCIGHEKSDTGDYRTVYCKNCWDIGEKYREEIEQYEKNIEKLQEQWEKECEIKKNN